MVLFTWTPARYMNDLSEKWTPNTPNLFVIGMSKKKGTKEANTRAYGPDASRFAVGSTQKKQQVVIFPLSTSGRYLCYRMYKKVYQNTYLECTKNIS